jgi:hypothetical protein
VIGKQKLSGSGSSQSFFERSILAIDVIEECAIGTFWTPVIRQRGAALDMLF